MKRIAMLFLCVAPLACSTLGCESKEQEIVGCEYAQEKYVSEIENDMINEGLDVAIDRYEEISGEWSAESECSGVIFTHFDTPPSDEILVLRAAGDDVPEGAKFECQTEANVFGTMMSTNIDIDEYEGASVPTFIELYDHTMYSKVKIQSNFEPSDTHEYSNINFMMEIGENDTIYGEYQFVERAPMHNDGGTTAIVSRTCELSNWQKQ